MIDIDDDLFTYDDECMVARRCYKHHKGIMCASTLQITGYNVWDMIGVYFLFYKKELVYIGKSDSHIGGRIKSHEREDRFNFDAFFIYECDNPTELESALIFDMKPKHNAIGKLKKYK
jgi:hypothetical protein